MKGEQQRGDQQGPGDLKEEMEKTPRQLGMGGAEEGEGKTAARICGKVPRNRVINDLTIPAMHKNR